MNAVRRRRLLCCLLLLLIPAWPALASFHLMQIEQVTGGMCDHTSQQAVQLRLRSAGQNQVSGTQLVAYDAAGNNPVTVLVFPSNVSVGTGGARILVASSSFVSAQGITPDFTMMNPIPADYLPAGRLTFQNGSTILWSLSWGGTAYTGSTLGSTDNDADGNFGPSWPGVLTSGSDQALLFQGAANAQSTNNAANYALTPGAATFTRNNGTAVQVIDCTVFADGFESGNSAAWSITQP